MTVVTSTGVTKGHIFLMPSNSDRHHRRSVRLRGYDYTSPGTYFITICVKNRECLFGNFVNGEMRLNGLGEIVQAEWLRTAGIRREITLDAFVVMPNHVHGILHIQNIGFQTFGSPPVGADGRPPLQRTARSLGAFAAGFKSITTKRINQLRNTAGIPVWQRNYHEHIIRNDDELKRIRRYITENPLHWDSDRENPEPDHPRNTPA